MLTKIKFNKVEYFKIADNGIEPAGLAKIAEIIKEAGLPAGVLKSVEPVWATRKGTFPKRLAKALKARGYSASPALLGAVGQVAADNCSRAEEYWVRIDPNFTNEESGFPYLPGEHGDDESCFHPGGRWDHAPYAIEEAGGMLLRTFTPAPAATGYHSEDGQYYAGIGRCFIIPSYVAGDDDYIDVLVMVNGYCQPGHNHDLLHLARLISTVEGLAYRKVRVRDYHRNVFINGDSGYLIGPWDRICDVKSVDVYIPSTGRTPTRVVYNCSSCGERFYDEDDLTAVGDGLICPDCLQIDYTVCGRCGEWAPKWDAPTVAGERWCRTCADECAVKCAQCGEWHPETEVYEVYKAGREFWCESCYDKYAVECSKCGDCYAPGEICELDGRAVCWDCAHNTCSTCGKTVDKPLKVDGLPYCRQCAPV